MLLSLVYPREEIESELSQTLAYFSLAFPGGAGVKTHLPLQKTQVWSLGWEDPLEEEMTTHSNIAWKIPWSEEPRGLQSMGVAKSWIRLRTHRLSKYIFH